MATRQERYRKPFGGPADPVKTLDPIQTLHGPEGIGSGNSCSYNLWGTLFQAIVLRAIGCSSLTIAGCEERGKRFWLQASSTRLMSLRGRRTSVITYERNFNYDTMKLRTIAQSDDLLITYKKVFFVSSWWHCSGNSCTSLGYETEYAQFINLPALQDWILFSLDQIRLVQLICEDVCYVVTAGSAWKTRIIIYNSILTLLWPRRIVCDGQNRRDSVVILARRHWYY